MPNPLQEHPLAGGRFQIVRHQVKDRSCRLLSRAQRPLFAQLGDPARAHHLWAKAVVIYEAIEDPNAEKIHRQLAALQQD